MDLSLSCTSVGKEVSILVSVTYPFLSLVGLWAASFLVLSLQMIREKVFFTCLVFVDHIFI